MKNPHGWALAGWMALGALVSSVIGQAIGQPTYSPAAVNGCVYFSAQPTLANGQQYVLTCDINGNLNVKTH